MLNGRFNRGRVTASETREYQRTLADIAENTFPNQVRLGRGTLLREEREYRFKNPSFRGRTYNPVVDLAIGPFAEDDQLIEVYDTIFDEYRPFVERLVSLHDQNVIEHSSDFRGPSAAQLRYSNQNSGYFIATEIERGNPDLKYLMGSALNAAALGRIGIVVCWDQRRLGSMLRARE